MLHSYTENIHSYPIIYIITVCYCPFFSFPAGLLTPLLQVLPLAAARYNDFAKDDTPFSVVIIADGFYLSSGFLNVLLYRYTRPYLLPHRMDSVDDQSIMLEAEVANGQNYLTNPCFVGSVMEIKPEYEPSEITHPQNETYLTNALTASPVRYENYIRDESTEAGATNIDDDT